MGKIRTVSIVTMAAIIAVFAIGYLFVLSPQKASTAKVHKSVTTQQAANDLLSSQLARLKQEQAKVPEEQARIAAIESRIPATPALPGYVRFLNTASTQSHVELVSVAPGAPVAVTVLAPPAPVAAASTGAAASGAEASAAAPVSTLSSIRVTLNVVGGYFAVQAFVKQLEGSGRGTVVSSITMTPGKLPAATATGAAAAGADTSYKTLQTVITATIFMSNAPTAPPAATAVAPAAGTAATPAVSATPSSTSTNS